MRPIKVLKTMVFNMQKTSHEEESDGNLDYFKVVRGFGLHNSQINIVLVLPIWSISGFCSAFRKVGNNLGLLHDCLVEE